MERVDRSKNADQFKQRTAETAAAATTTTTQTLMNDPFFDDEDDGDFEEFYGQRRTSSKPRPNDAATAPAPVSAPAPQQSNLWNDSASTPQPVASAHSQLSQSAYSYQESSGSFDAPTPTPTPTPAPALRRDLSNTRSTASTASSRRSRMRRKRSQDAFDVDWIDDKLVHSCQCCGSEFSLVKRKHHCRSCGQVICSDCSIFARFAETNKKHRICKTCVTLPSPSHGLPTGLALPRSSKPRGSLANMFMSKRQDESPHVHQHQSDTQQHERAAEEESTEPSLFNNADDTWFVEPEHPDEAEKAKKKAQARRDQAAFEMARQSLVPSSTRDYYDAMQQDMTQRHTIGGVAGGSLFGTQNDGRRPSTTTRAPAPPEIDDGDDDDAFALPGDRKRPSVRQQPAPSSARPAESHSSDEAYSERPTFKDNIKGLFHSKDQKKKKSKKKKDAKQNSAETTDHSVPESTDRAIPRPSQARDPFAYNGIQPSSASASYASETGFAAARPTFYENNADDLVVDDSPGYYEEMDAKRQAQEREQLRLQQALAAQSVRSATPLQREPSSGRHTIIGAAPAALPQPTVAPPPAPPSQEPVPLSQEPPPTQSEKRKSEAKTPEKSATTNSGGFAGALRRFFGISPSKDRQQTAAQGAPRAEAKTVVERTQQPRHHQQQQQPEVPAAAASSDAMEVDTFHDTRQPSSSGASAFSFETIERPSIPDMTTNVKQESFRHTMAGYDATPASFRLQIPADRFATSRDGTSDRTSSGTQLQSASSTRTLQRRDTFDDLFASPKSRVSRANRSGPTSMPTRSWDTGAMTTVQYASVSGVGRFDQRIDDRDDPILIAPIRPTIQPAQEEAPRADQRVSSWSAASAAASPNVTYAVPTSLREVSNERNWALADTSRFDQPQTPQRQNIMDDLRPRAGVAPSAVQRDPLDELFADFERPKDYVFDPETGGYVSAGQPPVRLEQPRYSQQGGDRGDFVREPTSQSAVHNGAIEEYRQSTIDPRHYQVTSTRLPVDNNYEERTSLDDEVADTIVDKISSLESELANLKQMIRGRRSHDGQGRQSTSMVGSRDSQRPSVSSTTQIRKQSIFDDASSEEEDDDSVLKQKLQQARRNIPEDKPASVAKRKSKVVKKRKDSFADLFDDSPKGELTGGTGYEALFQTANDPKEAQNSSEESDTDMSKAHRARKSAVAKRGSQAKARKPMSFSDEEPEQARFSKHASTKTDMMDSSSLGDANNEQQNLSAPISHHESNRTTKERSTARKKKQPVDEIDALFGGDGEKNLDDLFGSDPRGNEQKDEDEDQAGDDPVEQTKGSAAAAITKIPSVAAMKTNDTEVNFVEYDGGRADSDEEFNFSLKKMKQSRGKQKISAEQPLKKSASDLDASDEEIKLSPLLVEQKESAVSFSPLKLNEEAEVDDDFDVDWSKIRKSRARAQASTRSSIAQSSPEDASDSNVEHLVNLSKDDDAGSSSVEVKATSRQSSFYNTAMHVESSAEFSHLAVSESVLNEGLGLEAFASEKSHFMSSMEVTSEADFTSLAVEIQETEVTTTRRTSTGKPTLDKKASSSDTSDFGSLFTADDSKLDNQSVNFADLDGALDGSGGDGSFDPLSGMDADDSANQSLPTIHNTPFVKSASRRDSWMTPALSSIDEHDHQLPSSLTSNLLGEVEPSIALDDLSSFSYAPTGYVAPTEETATADSNDSDDDDATETVSFEVQPQKRRSHHTSEHETNRRLSQSPRRTSAASDLGNEALTLGKYAQPAPRSEAADDAPSDEPASELSKEGSTSSLSGVTGLGFGDNWESMQQQEKDRKKRLQMKQRQAQREKLKKQGSVSKAASSRNVVSKTESSRSVASNDAAQVEEKKKKKKKSRDTDKHEGASSERRTSRKHRTHEKQAENGDNDKNGAESTISTTTEL
ncbi:TPA: hypothetical protein N0F65_009755 [Lagenidium giganteum]|uniref:FYVE-type domain-containing protein n=1 Tax=Lagenidium giganteum TaxID=4803 RepID=A0AAV2YP26_9STRA|nr:TPA: hypothetical protein N0F65_009755 [Lagenidium giganteum]